MKKNFTTTLVMLAVFAGLSAWYAFYEQKYKPEQKEQEEQNKRLVTLEADQIGEIELVRMKNPPPENTGENVVPSAAPITKPEYEKIVLKKGDKDWALVEPLQDQADTVAVTAMLSSLTTTKQERTVDEKPKDLAPYGLKDPILRIVVKSVKTDSSAKGQEVLIGANTPVAYSIYAKTSSGDSVFKVSRGLRSSLEKDLLALRNKSILNFTRTETTEVEIQNAKENIVLANDGKDAWVLSRENLPADANEWNKTLNSLIEIKAMQFASEKSANLSEFGLTKPLAKVQFTKKDKSRVGLWVGKAKGKLYAKRDDRDVIFEVDKTLEEKLNTPAATYRNKQLAIFNRYDISHIKLQKGAEAIELQRGENSVWSFPAEPAVKIDGSQVDSLLTRLQDTKISQYLSNKSPKEGLPSPALKISLYEKKNNAETPVTDLSFSVPKGNEVPVSRSGLAVLFQIKAEDFEKLNVSKQSFVKVEEKAKAPVKGAVPETTPNGVKDAAKKSE